MRTRVKICGITRVEDAAVAVAHGVDAIGLVFYRPSPRAVEPEVAARICAALPPFVTAVGLFVDASESEVAATLEQVPLELLQFHGDESPAWCDRFARPWIKALRMRPGFEPEHELKRYRAARGLLLDAYDPALPGGTGRAFDWDRIPPAMAARIVLAGGLDPDNVGEAIARVRPYAVDVSGGVEERKGIKSAARIAAFMAGVRRADQSNRGD